VLLSTIIVTSESFGEPRICKTGFELILKARTNSPACVKPSSVEKLVARGWGIMPPNSMESTKAPAETLTEPTKAPAETLTEPTEVSSTNVIEANNQFAFEFYSKVAKDNKENVFFSPWSITTAFAIAYEGAKENTAGEMRHAFQFPADDKQRRSEFASIIEKLNEKDAKYKLRIANALWLKEGFQPLPEYLETAKTNYDSEVNTVNFLTNGIDIINNWVDSKTEGKITELFAPNSLDETTQLAITNAIYFKGTWVIPFDKTATSDENFWLDTQNVVKVPTMKISQEEFNHAQTEQLQILELPYEGNKISMLILLPKQKDGLKQLEESFTMEKLEQWKPMFSKVLVSIQIPKFVFEITYGL